MHGLTAAAKVYAIKKFGCFDTGLVFDILEQIKLDYGDLSCVAMSIECNNYIQDYLRPLKKLIKSYELDPS